MVERQEGSPGEQNRSPEQIPFSESAQQVMQIAEEEARRLNHNLIGSEHLLLGLIRNPTIEGKFLAYNIDPTRIRSAVEFIIGRGEGSTNEELGLTPRFQKIIDLASQEARNTDKQEIEPKDLLTGIFREGKGAAASVLESLGLTVEKFNELIIKNHVSQLENSTRKDLETIIKSIENEESLRTAYELDVVLKDPNVDPETKELLTNTIRNAIELAKRAKPQPNS